MKGTASHLLEFLKVIPLGLNIPVGWRQPSYKILKGFKEF